MSFFQARQAVRMRLPLWLRLLMPLMVMYTVLALTAGSIALLWSLHQAVHPGISFRTISGGAFALIFFLSFLGIVAPALMLLNLCLRGIPPLRRIFEENTKGVPRASYDESMSGLRKAATVLVPPSFLLALIGPLSLGCLKGNRLFARALPAGDLRYFSNAKACFSSEYRCGLDRARSTFRICFHMTGIRCRRTEFE
jgi:hypothetical protein